MLGFIGFAVYTIIGGLADVGFDTIWRDAGRRPLEPRSCSASSSRRRPTTPTRSRSAAVSPKPVPVGVTTIEQFAIGFVNIAVPSAAGRIATNARYFQKFGISAVTSTTTGAITGFIGFIAQAILVVLTIVVGAGSIDFSEMQGGGRRPAAAGHGGRRSSSASAIVVALVPKWRHWARSKLARADVPDRRRVQDAEGPEVGR